MQIWTFLLIKPLNMIPILLRHPHPINSKKQYKQQYKSVNVIQNTTPTSCNHSRHYYCEMNTSIVRSNRNRRVNKKVYHMQISISIIPIMIACGILMRFLCLSMFALWEYIKRPPSTRSTMRNKWQNLFAWVC